MDNKYPTEEQIKETLEAFQMGGKEGLLKLMLKREVEAAHQPEKEEDSTTEEHSL